MISTTNESNLTEKKAGKKRGMAVGLTVGLLGGSAAGLVFGVPGMTSAASSDTPAAIVQQADETDPAANAEAGEGLRENLQPLVEFGVITSDQADAVTTHLMENRPERGERGEGRPGGRRGPGGASSEAVLELLGIDAETLRGQIRDGSSLADIAAENGVDVQTVIDTLVEEATEHLDEAIANGRIEADAAAEKAAGLEERVTARVNGERPERPERPAGADEEG